MRNIIGLALATLLFCSNAQAKTLEEIREQLTANLIKKVTAAIDTHIKAERKLLEKLKKRNKAVGFCIPSRADYNFDGVVDEKDQLYFNFCFNNGGVGLGCRAADLSDDGAVNLVDFAMFAGEVGKSGDTTNPDLCVVPATPTLDPIGSGEVDPAGVDPNGTGSGKP